MAFNIKAYYEDSKDYYGNVPLEEVARDVYERGFKDKHPDYNTWKQSAGIDSALEEDRRLRNPTFEDKLRAATDRVAPDSGGVVKSFLQGGAEGITTELPSMIGGALQFSGSHLPFKGIENAGKSLKDWAEEKRQELYGPEIERTGLDRIVYEGTKMLAPSLIPGGVAGTIARGAKGVNALLKAGKVAEATAAAKSATNIAGGSAAALFGLSQAQQTKDTAEQEGVDPGLAPYVTGAIEAAGEFLGTKYLAKLFRLDEAEIVQRGTKEFVKDLIKTIGVETGTEIGQASGEAAVEKYSGIRPNANPIMEAIDVIGPTAFMTILTGGLAGAANKLRSQDPEEKAAAQYIEKLKAGAMFSMAINEGLKTGEYEGVPFTPQNAIGIIKEAQDRGIFDTADLDRFKDKYPQLSDGINGLIAENVTKKIDEAVTNTLTNTAQNLSDIPINKPDVRKEELPPGAATTVKKLQDQITRQEDYLARNANRKGETQYEKWAADLEQKKTRLAELTKPAEKPTPLAPAKTSTIETPKVKGAEIVEPAANVEGKIYENALEHVSRGGTPETRQLLQDAINKEPQKIADLQNAIKQDNGNTITLYRVSRGKELQGIESFTDNPNIAKEMGADIKIEVPVDSIVGYAKYQPKEMWRSVNESEVLVDISRLNKAQEGKAGESLNKGRLGEYETLTENDGSQIRYKYSEDEPGRLVVDDISVKNKRKGIGSKLLQQAIDQSDNGIDTIQPSGNGFTDEGLEFFKKFGKKNKIKIINVTSPSYIEEKPYDAPAAEQAAKTEVTGKQPYELSRAEYVQAGGLKMKGRAAEHKKAVAQAIAEGKITEHQDYPELSEPKEIFIRAAEKRDLARVKKSLKEIPDKFGYEKVYQKKGKQGRGFYYVKMKVKEVKAEKQAPPPSGAENLVTFLQRAGKVRLGEEFQDKTGDAWSRAHGFRSKDRSREMGDIASVTSQNGKMAMDEAASFVNAEGFRDKNGDKFTDRTLFEALAAGEGRNILHPGKAERIIEKQIEEKENEYWSEREEEYLDQQREALAQEGIDAGRIQESSESVRADLISEIEAEGNLTEEQLEAAHDEISSFFDEMSKAEETPRTETTDAGEQHTLAGLSAAETFTLTAKEPETPVVKGAKLTPKNLQPKEKIGDLFGGEKAEGIKEWQDIPELDAQIRTIKEPVKDSKYWTIEIGVQESLGEQGGDILTWEYDAKPNLDEIKNDILAHYKEEKIEINKEVAMGIVAKSGRDEMREEAIDKVIENKPETKSQDEINKEIVTSLQEVADKITEIYKVPKIAVEITTAKGKGAASYNTWRVRGGKINNAKNITIYNYDDIKNSKGEIMHKLSHELAHHIENTLHGSLKHDNRHGNLEDDLGSYMSAKMRDTIKTEKEIMWFCPKREPEL
jgi:hypothetical protein